MSWSKKMQNKAHVFAKVSHHTPCEIKYIILWDGNSSEIFTPRGIEESRNGNLPFLEDPGRKNIFFRLLGDRE